MQKKLRHNKKSAVVPSSKAARIGHQEHTRYCSLCMSSEAGKAKRATFQSINVPVNSQNQVCDGSAECG